MSRNLASRIHLRSFVHSFWKIIYAALQ